MTSGPTAAPPSETHAQSPAATDAYDNRTIRLHWMTAVIVALLWGIAEVIDLFPRGAPRIAVRSVHISLGVLLVAVLVRRLIWRRGPSRHLPPARGGFCGHAARMSHGPLYTAILALGLLRISNASP